MTEYRCSQCSKGPCMLTRAGDPNVENETTGSGCPEDGIFTKWRTAVWERIA